ncbi:MAG: hypothetical protein HZA54_18250, partial [Planctomycetes bacterium]|nr:hypothetical protein [Planctomycetota bacterium]
AWTVAAALLARGDAAAALLCLDAVAGPGARDPLVLAQRARALGDLGRLPESDAAWASLLEVAPGHALAEISLARSARAAGRFDEADRRFRAALRTLGEVDWLLSEIAWTAALAGRTRDAEGLLARGLELTPDSGVCLLARARLCARTGRPQEALDDLERVAAVHGLREPGIRADPDFARLAGEPRFARLFTPK